MRIGAVVCLLLVALHGLWAEPRLHHAGDDDASCALCHHASPPFDEDVAIRFTPPAPLELALPFASLPAAATLEALVLAPKHGPPAVA